MKKILFSLFIFACWSHLQAQTVSENNALEVATNYFGAKTDKAAVHMKTIQAPALRGGTPAYYVCVPEDEKGFVIVAGIKSSTPILAYSTDNIFSTDHMSPEVQYWMNGYKEQLEEIMANRLQPTPQMNARWKALESGPYDAPENNAVVAPLLQTTWNQNPLYNKFCPSAGGMQAPVGCVATAMAQIMKYWNFPVGGSTYVSDVDMIASNGISGTFNALVGGVYYNWANMPNSLVSGTQSQIDEIARLSYHCGLAVKTDYGTNESSSNMTSAKDAFNNIFGYQSCTMIARSGFSDIAWADKIRSELNVGRPIWYRGSKTATEGHAWVCDGYDGDMFHMNWGWGGSANGSYYLSDLYPTGTTSHYNLSQGAIIGIQPPGCVAFFEGSLPTVNGSTLFSLETTSYIHLSGGTAQSGTVCTIHAGNEVVLKPGFTALAGSTVDIFISGCDGALLPTDNEDRSQTETPDTKVVTTDLNVFPNPFSGSTTITYTLSAAQKIDMQVFDMVGKLVGQPIQQEFQDAGQHEYNYQADNLLPGVYFLVLQTGGQKQTKRLVLTR